MTAGPSRFDRDPDALAWARLKVKDLESRWRKFAESAADAGKDDQADMWRYLANGVRNELIGGEGCVIAAFDERRASLPPVADGEPPASAPVAASGEYDGVTVTICAPPGTDADLVADMAQKLAENAHLVLDPEVPG